ncbi:hypothetical protein KKF34_03805 [Myxococcota bacterium]|nr:hypothetical protein [Myxococcota bacterium]MBU1381345.1 hypothetical protein [Myxococcota bacterium]MBU1495981.1 hypothetical protein [Myxococcota bacterium]
MESIDDALLKKDIRSLIHDIRGAVSVISSSIELLQFEDSSAPDMRFLEMIRRQTQKILAVSVLFGETFSPTDNSNISGRTDLMECLSELQEMIGIEFDLNYIPSEAPFLLNSQSFLLKLALVSILSSYSASSENIFLNIDRHDNTVILTFKSEDVIEMQRRHVWASNAIQSLGGTMRNEGHMLVFELPIWKE